MQWRNKMRVQKQIVLFVCLLQSVEMMKKFLCLCVCRALFAFCETKNRVRILQLKCLVALNSFMPHFVSFLWHISFLLIKSYSFEWMRKRDLEANKNQQELDAAKTEGVWGKTNEWMPHNRNLYVRIAWHTKIRFNSYSKMLPLFVLPHFHFWIIYVSQGVLPFILACYIW